MPERAITARELAARQRFFSEGDRVLRRSNQDQRAIDALRSSARWQRVRARYLSRHPLCEDCQAHGVTRQAEQVDHVIGLAMDKTRAFDPTNLRALCTSCHARKSAHERQAGINRNIPQGEGGSGSFGVEAPRAGADTSLFFDASPERGSDAQ